jgi:anti-sigma B factor antagonist
MQPTAINNYGRPLETQDRPDSTPHVPVSELCLTINRTPTETTVHCGGRITMETAQSLRATVQPLFSDSTTVVLDLINVGYVDSSGLGAIVGLCTSAKAANCELKLVNLNRRLKESLNMARVNELLVDPAFWRTW